MAKKKQAVDTLPKVNFAFFRHPAGYFFTAVSLWIIGYILVSLAIDSGSLLEWSAGIVAVVWGLVRFVQGIVFSIKK